MPQIYTYEFYGKVHPERANFSINGPPPARLTNEAANVEGEIQFECSDSNAKLIFKTEINVLKRPDSDILATLRNLVSEYGRFYVDTYCYIRSFNYDLEIIGVKCPELYIDTQFSVKLEDDLEPGDDSQTIALSINSKITDITLLAAKSPRLFEILKDAFADFRRGIKYPHMSGFFFYRALETIRSNYFDDFSLPEKDRSAPGWKKMNNELDLSELYYDDLNKFRRVNAHGVYPPITGQERVKLAKDTRKVIDLFINYAKNCRPRRVKKLKDRH